MRVSAWISVLLPAANPMRQPAIEYVLLIEVNSMAISRAPGTCSTDGGGTPSK